MYTLVTIQTYVVMLIENSQSFDLITITENGIRSYIGTNIRIYRNLSGTYFYTGHEQTEQKHFANSPVYLILCTFSIQRVNFKSNAILNDIKKCN